MSCWYTWGRPVAQVHPISAVSGICLLVTQWKAGWEDKFITGVAQPCCGPSCPDAAHPCLLSTPVLAVCTDSGHHRHPLKKRLLFQHSKWAWQALIVKSRASLHSPTNKRSLFLIHDLMMIVLAHFVVVPT